MRTPMVLLSLVAAIPAMASDVTVKNDGPACRMRKTFDRLIEVSGDSRAYHRFLATRIVNGDCVMLEQGMTVLLQRPATPDGFIVVRPQGERQGFYTMQEVISD